MKSAVVVGSGPNGVAAGITLARAGWSVHVHEAEETLGGGSRTLELTLPGFRHDPCSAVHPIAQASPFFQSLDLAGAGLTWIEPPVPLAHPFDDGTAATLLPGIVETAASLGDDGDEYVRLMEPLLADFDTILPIVLGPLRPTPHLVAFGRFGLQAVQSVTGTISRRFLHGRGAALFAGMGAHAMLPLDSWGTTAFALTVILCGHRYGWPIPKGGSQSIIDAMIASSAGSLLSFTAGDYVTDLDRFGDADALLMDVAPRNLISMRGATFSSRYRRRVGHFHHGPGVFKIDWALSGPVDWTAEAANLAGTLHLGGTAAEIVLAENAVAEGRHADKPFVLIAQPSRFDDTRAPAGHHTLWGYCHVPNGSDVDMTEAIERQIERFAPGFRSLVLARATKTAREMEAANPNYVGGDINCGAQGLTQMFTRPTMNVWDPYATPDPRVFLCSSATPPGGGVHGMCGYHAANSVLRARK